MILCAIHRGDSMDLTFDFDICVPPKTSVTFLILSICPWYSINEIQTWWRVLFNAVENLKKKKTFFDGKTCRNTLIGVFLCFADILTYSDKIFFLIRTENICVKVKNHHVGQYKNMSKIYFWHKIYPESIRYFTCVLVLNMSFYKFSPTIKIKRVIMFESN